MTLKKKMKEIVDNANRKAIKSLSNEQVDELIANFKCEKAPSDETLDRLIPASMRVAAGQQDPIHYWVLQERASRLAGRDLDMEKTVDNKYIVMFMHLTLGPPPKGDTEIEAWENFIEWYKGNFKEPPPLEEYHD